LPSPPGSAPGLVLLLLDLLLITCPSPPGLDLELQYILIVLLDDFSCLSGAVQELVMFLVMFPCWLNGRCFSWWCSSSRLLGLQAAMVLPAPASQSCDWAACVLYACLPHSIWSHPLLAVLWNYFAPLGFAPQLITEQILHFVL
jgi:hypothetical protein